MNDFGRFFGELLSGPEALLAMGADLTHEQLTDIFTEADKRAARRRLHEFVLQSFGVNDPVGKFRDSWMYGVVCEYAEAFIRGELKRVIPIHPPGTFKTGIWSVAVPAFSWVGEPWLKWIVNSNEKTLVTEVSTKCRDVLKSDWYIETFQPSWQIRGGADAVNFFSNTARGTRRGVSTNSKVGGKKAHRIVCDDLHDAKYIKSPKHRKSDKDWFRNNLADRTISFKEGGIAFVGHRVDSDDLQSELMLEGWEVLHIPERMEERFRRPYVVGGLKTDPRAEGEYLRPWEVGPEQETAIRLNSEDKWHTSHQGDPQSAKGSLFPSPKWRMVELPEYGTEAIRFWDTAASEGETASWTCGILVGRQPSGRFIVLDVRRERLEADKRDELILSVAHDDRHIASSLPGVHVRETAIENPGGSGGKQVGQILVNMLAGFNVEIVNVSGKGNKIERAKPASSQQRGGNFDLLDVPFSRSFKVRMENVHNSTEQDDMDALSGAFNRLASQPIGFKENQKLTPEKTALDNYQDDGTFGDGGTGATVNTNW